MLEAGQPRSITQPRATDVGRRAFCTLSSPVAVVLGPQRRVAVPRARRILSDGKSSRSKSVPLAICRVWRTLSTGEPRPELEPGRGLLLPGSQGVAALNSFRHAACWVLDPLGDAARMSCPAPWCLDVHGLARSSPYPYACPDEGGRGSSRTTVTYHVTCMIPPVLVGLASAAIIDAVMARPDQRRPICWVACRCHPDRRADVCALEPVMDQGSWTLD